MLTGSDEVDVALHGVEGDAIATAEQRQVEENAFSHSGDGGSGTVSTADAPGLLDASSSAKRARGATKADDWVVPNAKAKRGSAGSKPRTPVTPRPDPLQKYMNGAPVAEVISGARKAASQRVAKERSRALEDVKKDEGWRLFAESSRRSRKGLEAVSIGARLAEVAGAGTASQRNAVDDAAPTASTSVLPGVVLRLQSSASSSSSATLQPQGQLASAAATKTLVKSASAAPAAAKGAHSAISCSSADLTSRFMANVASTHNKKIEKLIRAPSSSSSSALLNLSGGPLSGAATGLSRPLHEGGTVPLTGQQQKVHPRAVSEDRVELEVVAADASDADEADDADEVSPQGAAGAATSRRFPALQRHGSNTIVGSPLLAEEAQGGGSFVASLLHLHPDGRESTISHRSERIGGSERGMTRSGTNGQDGGGGGDDNDDEDDKDDEDDEHTRGIMRKHEMLRLRRTMSSDASQSIGAFGLDLGASQSQSALVGAGTLAQQQGGSGSSVGAQQEKQQDTQLQSSGAGSAGRGGVGTSSDVVAMSLQRVVAMSRKVSATSTSLSGAADASQIRRFVGADSTCAPIVFSRDASSGAAAAAAAGANSARK